MKIAQSLFMILITICITANAVVYEASKSSDVDLFVQEFHDETIALLFYDSEEKDESVQNWFSSLASRVLGMFKSQDQEGKSTEDWVEMFDDKLHLMKIDVQNEQLLRTLEEYNIEEEIPFVIMQDKRRVVLREKVQPETYVKVRELLDKRPNMLHKTGGAMLKSFSIGNETGNTTSEPIIIQYFDLEEGEPTKIEEPTRRQYVNWGSVDIIGPDGKWMKRGEDMITSYEIPESGILNQENPDKAVIVSRISDDSRPVEAQQITRMTDTPWASKDIVRPKYKSYSQKVQEARAQSESASETNIGPSRLQLPKPSRLQLKQHRHSNLNVGYDTGSVIHTSF